MAGIAAGAVMAAIFGVLVIWLNTNQYATGLALSLFRRGVLCVCRDLVCPGKNARSAQLRDSRPLGHPLCGPRLVQTPPDGVPDGIVCTGVDLVLYRTRAGLILRSVGESPESAHALGYPVRAIRLGAVVCGGALCGLAGAYISVIYTPLWVEGMVAGKGWIALALTTFATWRPARVLLGAYLFGGVTMLQFHLQGIGVEVPSQFLTMLPYLATIVVLALISRNPRWIRINMPASIGKPFYPGS